MTVEGYGVWIILAVIAGSFLTLCLGLLLYKRITAETDNYSDPCNLKRSEKLKVTPLEVQVLFDALENIKAAEPAIWDIGLICGLQQRLKKLRQPVLRSAND